MRRGEVWGVDAAVRRALYKIVASNITEAEAWSDHVVLSRVGPYVSVDIPATFDSRLNAELSPLMAKHAKDIWGKSDVPVLHCKPPEVQVVSFSMKKSSRIPAICLFEADRHNRSIRDIRDLRVTFPTASSRHMMRVRVAEERPALTGSGASPRRFHSWGTFRGPIQVDLSDTGKIALQRYCGETDTDVDMEPLDPSDVRLVTVLELKRLHSLWTSGTPQPPGTDNMTMFRAVVSPLDLAPAYASSVQSIQDVLGRYLRRQAGDDKAAATLAPSHGAAAAEIEPLEADAGSKPTVGVAASAPGSPFPGSDRPAQRELP
jgi:hypothetical protein